MLEVARLRKSFGALTVTNNVSLTVAKGERRVLLGPNGAGKTTLFNLLTGDLTADSGTVRLAGQDVTALPPNRRARLGLARSYQRNNLFDELTIRENFALAIATARGRSARLIADPLSDPEIGDAIAEAAARVGLADLLDRTVAAASYGARRQLEVGLALAARPSVLLMDEPTSGVGPEMIKGFHTLLTSLPRDLTIIIIEHDMDLALDIADRVTVLNYGEVIFEGTPAQTRASALVNEIYLGSWEPAHA
jgi:branched-chain amino acid transport system ATP-binding protein